MLNYRCDPYSPEIANHVMTIGNQLDPVLKYVNLVFRSFMAELAKNILSF